MRISKILFVLFFITSSAFAEWSVFLLMGQSNMAGMAATPGEIDKEENPQVRVLAYTNCSSPSRIADEWYVASPPLHNCTEGVGPGDWFAKTLIKEGYSDTIALVPVAVSGASIDLFRKDYAFSSFFLTSLPFNNATGAGYNWIIKRLEKALQKGKLKGILFHQGESDCSAWGGNPNTWLDRVKGVYDNIITDLNIDYKVPFIAGELSRTKTDFNQMNPLINQFPDIISNAVVVSSENLSRGSDDIHFTTESQRTFGERYATAYLKWLEENTSSSSSTISSSSSIMSSSSSEVTTLEPNSIASMWNAYVNGSSIQIENISIGSLIQIMDIQGNVLFKTKASSKNCAFSINHPGAILLKIGNKIQRLNIIK